MEITIRVVHEASPELLRLLGALLPGGVTGMGPGRAVRVPRAPGAAAGGSSPAAVAPAAAAGLTRQNAPAAAAPVRRMRNSWRTEARRLLLEADWPRGRPVGEIRAQMAAMDGPALPRAKYVIATWAHELELVRPGMEARKWRTQERLAILQRDWPTGDTREVIAARMNELPGPPVPAQRLKVWAAEHGLVRPEGFLSAIRVGKRQGGRRPAAVAEAGPAVAVAGDDDADGQQEGHAPPRAPEVPGLSPAAAAGAPPEVPRASPAVVAPVVLGPAPKPPPLPAPAENGRVYACFRDLAAWAGFYGLAYDGTNIDRLNRLREARGLPAVVQDDTVPRVSGQGAAALAVAA